ncbi:unnamed protein product [Urochloa decumbens]|uniref:Uncharacterized protein n=1 Tax=Urochloa decumbens TaxID=240449 RepID=A0ABC9E8F5_9POAL
MSRLSHRRVPSVIPENIAILDFKQEEDTKDTDNTITGEKRLSMEDAQSMSSEIKCQNPKELSDDKKVTNKSSSGDGRNGMEGLKKDLAAQVKTDNDN